MTALTRSYRRGRTWFGPLDASSVLVVSVLLTLALRAPFVALPLGIDEGGYAYVAAHWSEGSGGIYGAQWVDRPPLLIALYAAAAALAGNVGIGALGCIAAMTVVATCADAAGRVAGDAARRWTAIVAAVLASSTATQANTVNAELPAIAFTSLAAWCVVRAVTTAAGPRRAAAWGVGGGVAATAAVLVKQSFVDGFAFALAFVVVLVICDERRRQDAAAVLVAGLVGALAAVAGAAAWAQICGPGVSVLLEALYGFRIEARSVIQSAPTAPSTRSWYLLAVSLASGVALLVAWVGAGLVRLASRRPDASGGELHRATAAGLLAMGAIGLAGVMLGGNWWMHYLIQLAPFLAIGAGVVAAAPPLRRRHAGRATRRIALFVVGASVVSWFGAVVWTYSEVSERPATTVGDWVAAASAPDDTVVVAWGHANVLHRTGLRTPYRFAWSLPVRVHDPALEELLGVMRGPDAPTWIIEWRAISSWGLDSKGHVRTEIWKRYVRVPDVCGKRVYRLRSATGGSLPPSPAGGCGSGRGLSIGDVKLF